MATVRAVARLIRRLLDRFAPDPSTPSPTPSATGQLVVARAQAELVSEEDRGRDLLTKVAILTALAGIELAGALSIISTELHNHLPLEHQHIALPSVVKLRLGAFLLAVLIALYALVLVGAGAGMLAL